MILRVAKMAPCKIRHRRFHNLSCALSAAKSGLCKNDWFLRLPLVLVRERHAEEMTIHVIFARAPRSGPSAKDARNSASGSNLCEKAQESGFNQKMCQILMGAT